MKAADYSILVEPLSEEDGGGFLARVPELPGCMSDGPTPEEALANMHDAIKEWLAQAETLSTGSPRPNT